MTSQIKNAKTIQNKSKGHTVKETGLHTFSVVSGTSGEEYTVTMVGQGATCTCPWGQYRRNDDRRRSGCSHVVAVYAHLESEAGRKVSAWTDESQARRQHRPAFAIGNGMILTSRVA